MSKFFYVIEWNDGSGKTSGITEASNAYDALSAVQRSTLREVKDGLYGSIGHRASAGDVITFNKVDD